MYYPSFHLRIYVINRLRLLTETNQLGRWQAHWIASGWRKQAHWRVASMFGQKLKKKKKTHRKGGRRKTQICKSKDDEKDGNDVKEYLKKIVKKKERTKSKQWRRVFYSKSKTEIKMAAVCWLSVTMAPVYEHSAPIGGSRLTHLLALLRSFLTTPFSPIEDLRREKKTFKGEKFWILG